MLRKSRVFALGVVAVVALRLLSEVPGQLRAQHDARSARGGPAEAQAGSLLMYDGVCNLCNGEWSARDARIETRIKTRIKT
jgi:hypothetical protein